MKIWETDKLVLFLAFFIPGFISIKIYDLLVPSERRDFSKCLIEAIGYSSLNYAAFFWLIILIYSNNIYFYNKILYFILLLIIIFIMPVTWPILFLKLSKWEPIARNIIHPVLKPWDYLFCKREAFWVIIHLKDGRKVGGTYGKNSFTSSYPSEEQIYLEKVWKLNENGIFLEPIEGSKGIIVSSSEILAIEFYK